MNTKQVLVGLRVWGLLIILLICSVQSTFAQSILTQRKFYRTARSEALEIVKVSNNYFIATLDYQSAFRNSRFSIPQVLLLKISSNLDSIKTIFTGIYANQASLKQDPVTGLLSLMAAVHDPSIQRSNPYSQFLATLDTNGNILWFNDYQEPQKTYIPNTYCQNSLGDFVVAGAAAIPTIQTHFVMYASLVANNGSVVWQKEYQLNFRNPAVWSVNEMKRDTFLLTASVGRSYYYNLIDANGTQLTEGLLFDYHRPVSALSNVRHYVLPNRYSIVTGKGENIALPSNLGNFLVILDPNLNIVRYDTTTFPNGLVAVPSGDTTFTSFDITYDARGNQDSLRIMKWSFDMSRRLSVNRVKLNPSLIVFPLHCVLDSTTREATCSANAGSRGWQVTHGAIRISNVGVPYTPPVINELGSVNQPVRLEATAIPNPIKSSVRFTGLPDRVYDYVVTAVTGQQVVAGRYSPSETLDLSGLPSGVYSIRLSAGQLVSYVRVVKE